MEYHLNELEPTEFQRLINLILVARFGEDIRLTPLRGQDGGRDGETAAGNPYFEFQVSDVKPSNLGIFNPLRKGRYLFQVKHHSTTDKRISDVRQVVVSDFMSELKHNVLSRQGDEQVNYFFLITNVPSSKDALEKIDSRMRVIKKKADKLYADVWWKERIIAFLDQLPNIWVNFPKMFAGGIVPLLSRVSNPNASGLPRAIRLAINQQYNQDGNVKFRQIELEENLSKLFVDLDIDIRDLSAHAKSKLETIQRQREARSLQNLDENNYISHELLIKEHLRSKWGRYDSITALGLLLEDDSLASIPRIILEGGPGQGKSTLTQMAVQIYREHLLGKSDIKSEGRWLPPNKIRLPFRIELRNLAEWMSNNREGSIGEYLSVIIKHDSGGETVKVEDIHTAVENSPVILIFDGLDEIGSDNLRAAVLKAITACIHSDRRQLFFLLNDNLNSRITVITKDCYYWRQVRRREPVGRPECHLPAFFILLTFIRF